MPHPRRLLWGAAAGLTLLGTAGLHAQEAARDPAGRAARVAQPATRKRRPTTRRTRPRLPDGFVRKTIKLPDGSKRNYLVFVPARYDLDKSRRWPVIVSLHGSGECGKNIVRPTKVGLPRYIATRPTRFPYITVVPQAHHLWFRGQEVAAVWAILEAVLREYRADRDRVYLTGYSMGGFGAWEMAIARPDVFAAIVPICGVGPERYVSNIVHLPVWAFHGARDKNVPVAGSRRPIAELKRLGARPKYTEYANKSHQVWDAAYATPGLWSWLRKQRRKPPPRVIDYRLTGDSMVIWWLGARAEEGRKAPARIHAEVDEQGRVTVRSEGISDWAIRCETYPLKIGERFQVTWNGDPVHEGTFDGWIAVTPRKEDE